MTDSNDGLRFGPLGQKCWHICVDMQRMFAEPTDWQTPWMERVSPEVLRIVRAKSDRTIFTRFMPAQRVGEGEGTWRRYYERWSNMTVETLGLERVDLMADLKAFVPPGIVFDKSVYSPWVDPKFDELIRSKDADTLIVTGGETDVCVLGTVLGGVDRGYRMIVVTDALCSSSDEAHDSQISVYQGRYGQQVETLSTSSLLQEWK